MHWELRVEIFDNIKAPSNVLHVRPREFIVKEPIVIALILILILRVISMGSATGDQPVVIPPMPNYAPYIDEQAQEDEEWSDYYVDAMLDYLAEFDSLFAKVEYKRASNGRSMVKSAHSNSFKFARTN